MLALRLLRKADLQAVAAVSPAALGDDEWQEVSRVLAGDDT